MKNERKPLYNKRGYLNEDFLLFHLQDRQGEQFEYHYHDFYKIVIFISGRVTYLIEGKAYQLKPWDILLITNRDIHKAVIETSEVYDRIIIWFNPGFLERNSSPGSNLSTCFGGDTQEKQSLLRLDPEELTYIRANLQELEDAFNSSSFGTDTVKKSLFLLLAVRLNRRFLQEEHTSRPNDAWYDETISQIVSYINDNINGDLSIASLSAKFYLSKYTLMHKFK